MTPFFFGTVAGAIASGRVPAAGYGDPVGSWVNPTSLVGGCLAVATCIFLAGVFLTADAARTGSTKLAGRLRIRTIVVGLAVGVIVFAGLYPVLHDAATLSTGLRGRAFPMLVVAGLAGATTLCCCIAACPVENRRRSFAFARITAALAVAAVIVGWGVGQYPWMLVGQLSIREAAGAPTTLAALLVVVVLAGVNMLPPFRYPSWFTHPTNRPRGK